MGRRGRRGRDLCSSLVELSLRSLCLGGRRLLRLGGRLFRLSYGRLLLLCWLLRRCDRNVSTVLGEVDGPGGGHTLYYCLWLLAASALSPSGRSLHPRLLASVLLLPPSLRCPLLSLCSRLFAWEPSCRLQLHGPQQMEEKILK